MKKLVILLTVVMVLSLWLGACGSKEPENSLEAIKDAGVVKVGISADYPPFAYVDEGGNFTGYAIDVDRELAKRLGVELELMDVPYDTLYTGLLEGKYDIADGNHMWTAEREEIMDMPQPYFIDKNVLLVAEDFDDGQIQSVEDIGKFIVGQQTGGVEEKFMRETLVDKGILPEENLVMYERVDSIAIDVKAGRVDLTMNKLSVLTSLVAELGGLKLIYIDGLPEGGVHMGVRDGEVELRDAIDKIFEDFKSEGFFDELADKYGMTG
jgi:ABC-type amino acid transport substrate-binding protein